MSVLLPAPFSPITASTSPRASERLTPLSARTPGKDLASRRTSRGGALTARLFCGHLRFQIGPELIHVVFANLPRGNVEKLVRWKDARVPFQQLRQNFD